MVCGYDDGANNGASRVLTVVLSGAIRVVNNGASRVLPVVLSVC